MAKEIKKIDASNSFGTTVVYTVPSNKVAEVHITDFYVPNNTHIYVGALYIEQYSSFSDASIGYDQTTSSHGDADAFVNGQSTGARLSPRKIKMIDGQDISLYANGNNVRFKAIIIEEDIGVQ